MACPLYVDQLIGRDQKTASIVLKVDRTAMADGRFAQTLSEMRTIARQMPGEGARRRFTGDDQRCLYQP